MTLAIPCPQVIRDCVCTDDPITNYSAEDADQPVFFGHYDQPPTTGTFFAPSCLGVCESPVSQQVADQCAALAAVECSFDDAPRAGNIFPGGGPLRQYGNTLQECTAECPDGNPTTVVQPAGSIVSFTQTDADARAYGAACKRAEELRVCFVSTSPLTSINADAFASIPIIATGGNGDYEFTHVSGTLPTGMSLDPVGLLLGTPTVPASYTFGITVTDSGGGSATKTFVLEIIAACGIATDWCADPGSCRLRIQNFNPLDWLPGSYTPDFGAPCDLSELVAWLGYFDNIYITGLNPCKTYDGINTFGGVPFASLDYDPTLNGGTWLINISLSGGTVFFATGPNDPSPLGTYTRDPAFSCTGPATLVIEQYTP